jgi:hypothetical protein
MSEPAVINITSTPEDPRSFNVRALPWEEVEKNGFAEFNRYPHLCVEVPDGGATISCRTKDGRLFTAAFVPYKENGPPECVDVQSRHKTGPTASNGVDDLPTQHVIVFGPRKKDVQVKPEDGYTLATVILRA